MTSRSTPGIHGVRNGTTECLYTLTDEKYGQLLRPEPNNQSALCTS
jgi:hypothetical protein